MLKNIPPMLSPELLSHLRAMGHGDELAIVDANFPADACARRLVRMDGTDACAVMGAVLELLPLDTYVPSALHTMWVVGSEDFAPIAADFSAIAKEKSPEVSGEITGLERFEFYERAKGAYLIITTGERRLYGNIILTKGVIAPN